MWIPGDIRAISTGADLVNTRDTILALEEELVDAQLKEELKALRAWIAPVQRLPFEILSPIFEMCGEMHWKAPISIAGVCRFWRNVVQNTPGAWVSTQVTNLKNLELLTVYLARNRQSLLHVTLQQTFLISELVPYVHGIQCIQVPNLPRPMGDICFPHLKSLRITGQYSSIGMDQVTTDHFPALRHLEIAGSLGDRLEVLTFSLPRISTLTIAHRWLGTPLLLRSLRETLLSLEIFFMRDRYSLDSHPIHLPRLKCLKVHRYAPMETMPFKIVAPALVTYIQWSSFKTSDALIHKDVGTVTHLRYANFRCLTVFPEVRVLQLYIPTHEVAVALKAIHDGHRFPSLTTIEFKFGRGHKVQKCLPMVEEWVKQYRSTLNILLTTDNWRIDLPGTIETWAPKPYYEGTFITPPPNYSRE
ncbi:hypothetical protein M408DRAFT_23095 [Serendipita vermifera MAFF 305830]|uniref:F-box domain-containing protein n=1 Tax=Serendipita vermifera MAFF 305830 TaxID=933852 RepID=A0A0C3AXR7_SERVB|nr:hypothetical protein M408DRAFT_23095 [Serendipita vermifera MAFF 305830]